VKNRSGKPDPQEYRQSILNKAVQAAQQSANTHNFNGLISRYSVRETLYHPTLLQG
jgi:hypothetical protein